MGNKIERCPQAGRSPYKAHDIYHASLGEWQSDKCILTACIKCHEIRLFVPYEDKDLKTKPVYESKKLVEIVLRRADRSKKR